MYDDDGYRAFICMTNAPCVMWITMQCKHNWIVLAKWISTLSFIIFSCIIHTCKAHINLWLYFVTLLSISSLFRFLLACVTEIFQTKLQYHWQWQQVLQHFFWYYAVHIMPGGRQGTNFHWSPKKLSIFPSPIFPNFAFIYYDKMYASTLPAFLSRKIMIIKK